MTLTLADARALIGFAQDAGRDLGKPISVTVVDAWAHVVASERQDGVPWFTLGVSRVKAQTSADMGADSASWVGLQQEYPDLWRVIDSQVAYGMTTVGGGVTIRVGDAVVGAIGVSGATEAEDQDIAVAAVNAWLNRG